MIDRRQFIGAAGALLGGAFLSAPAKAAAAGKKRLPVNAHLWVYASKFPPDWDCTPVLEQVFSDLHYAGIDGLELMDVNLRKEEEVTRLRELSEKYQLPVSGCSYSAPMWDGTKQSRILEEMDQLTDRLHALGGTILGLSVGKAGHVKTEEELDAQALVLEKIRKVCAPKMIVPNLHNHTYEVENGLHDLRGTLSRIPDMKLGPDINWLVRAGVDPTEFIRTYGKQMVYMHLRDQQADGKWTEAVGEGITDFPAIAALIKERSFTGRLAIELAFDKPPVRPLREDWKISRDYVEKVFNGK